MWCPSCGEVVGDNDLECSACGVEIAFATAESRRDRLGEDAARVGHILEVLSWLVLVSGGAAAVGALVIGVANSSGLTTVATVLVTAAYTAAVWAFTRLGAVLARYVEARVAAWANS